MFYIIIAMDLQFPRFLDFTSAPEKSVDVPSAKVANRIWSLELMQSWKFYLTFCI